MASSDRRGRLSREQIVDAAAATFYAKGYADTTLARVAERLNVTDKAIYYYFDGKDELYLHTLEVCADRIAAVIAAVDRDRQSGFEKVKAFIRAMIRQPDYLRLHIRGLPLHLENTEPGQRIRAAERAHDAVLIRWIEEGINDGSIVPGDPKMLWKWNEGGLVWLDVWSRREGANGLPVRYEKEAMAMLDRSLARTPRTAVMPPVPADGSTAAASPSTE
ncbi:MAG: TetR/AcrR family transcriptional regulator [Alphaproteobacteria bacterium]